MKKAIVFILLLIPFLVAGQAQERLKQLHSDVVVKKNGKEYWLHIVKRGQTLYMISKAYGVDVGDIIQENPIVKDGLKSDQKLMIPKSVVHEPVKKQAKAPEEETVAVKPVPEPEKPIPCEINPSFKKTKFNIALLMPLYLNEVVSMDIGELAKRGSQDCRPLQYIEFYEGFRMALDSLRKSGISLQVSVYDITKDTIRIRKAVRDPEMKKMDLIFGLLYNRPFQILGDFTEKNNIPLVNPISEREQIADKRPGIIKVRPSQKSQRPEVAKYLSENFSNANILILRNGQFGNKEVFDDMLKECKSRNLDARLTQNYETTLAAFFKEKENVIIAFSEDRSYILDLITKLNEWRNEYKIALIGLPRWDKLDDIEVDYLVNLQTHFVAPYFVDYDNNEVKKFVRNFQELYKTDPSPLAFQGFDVAIYFLTALTQYGKTFEHCLPEMKLHSLQTDFQFIPDNGNGWVNQHWEIYRYENFFLKGSPK
jgi:LysM repeat protein/ABC-type branched-subunit amino acid transport system substrate-binding protein